ncbi:MAG: thiol-disulfide isomerase [Bryobacteraceae bacterium]
MIVRMLVIAGVLSAALPAANVTFNKDVAPILYRRCVSCHHPNDIAPMSLLTYKDVRPWAAAIKEAVLSRKMPPWGADPRYGHWSNDARLDDGELKTIVAWTEGGRLAGNPKDLPAAPKFETGWKIGKPDVILSIPERTLSASGPDEYSYITVPTHFTEDKWVIAAELRPGNRQVVHHAHVFVVTDDAKPAAKREPNPAQEYAQWLKIREGTLQFIRPDAPVIDDGCLIDDNGAFPGSKQNPLGSLISSYLPGREADVYLEGTARKIAAGAKLNFQIHYHRNGKPETDATGVGLIFAKEPPEQVARRIDPSNHMFRIPAGDPNHEVTECHTFTQDMYVTSLTPHMHLRGKSMRMSVTYPDGRPETLLNVPKYDFNWQITYREAKPVFIPKGTRLRIDARFDNSANNPLNHDPAKVIRWGASSEVEMMDGWVEFTDAPLNAKPATLSAKAGNAGPSGN